MCFSDARFAYGPFAPHYVPRQYIENYVTHHKVDEDLVLDTTVEDLAELPPRVPGGPGRWKVVLRKYDRARHIDLWWEEEFDAVVLANGHYAVPFVPEVKGLKAFIEAFPDRVVHSKHYRTPLVYASKRVVVVGNSASGHDVTAELVSTAHLPVYQSRRSPSRWDGDKPPPGIAWKPVIREFQIHASPNPNPGSSSHPSGRIVFDDDTYLDLDTDVDVVLYCTGYKPSFPFWEPSRHSGRALWDYAPGADRLAGGGSYWHTFFTQYPTLAAVGVPRTLTFRSFEYQGVAVARLWAGRAARPLPPAAEQRTWERERAARARREGRRFHDVPWEGGEAREWLRGLFDLAGLGTLDGDGRVPPVLTRELVWALENVRKYPEPGRGEGGGGDGADESGLEATSRSIAAPARPEAVEEDAGEWVMVHRPYKMDLLGFI
ncbi:hypothetical protein SLS62_006789 [Diatrype stigma]|uniref:Flavin-containing monooxygenase n=1 Tax=Diatrype stigma TaxID=117547 RepID=A0AAN9UXU8_9PEZI